MKKKLEVKNSRTLRVETRVSKSYLQGEAKLGRLTQRMVYELILRRTIEKPGGVKTWQRILEIKKRLQRKWNVRVNEEEIWKGLKNIKNNKIQDFIWKIIHNRIRCGKFFSCIPGWEEKQFCKCREVESIDHILHNCKESNQSKLWKEVKKVWVKITGMKWIKPKMTDIMGIGSVKINKCKAKKVN